MKKKILKILLTLTMLLSMTISTVVAAEFSDMPNDWSTAALQNAVANGLLIGADGKVMPQDNLTRAQMATIVNRAFGATEKASLSPYTDVSTDSWYYDEMAKAVQMKTYVGSGNKLNPDSNITREEAFVVLARSFKLYGVPESVLDKFADKALVSQWAKDGVASLTAAGFIAGSNSKINPQQYITRAEFAQMMDNLLKNYIKSAGNHTSDFNGNLMINTPDVILKDLTITGDLIIGDGVGDGKVTLDSITVTGRTVIRSGVGSVIVRGDSPAPEALKIADFFPIKENVRYVYEGIGNEYAAYDVFIDYTSADKIQQRVNNGGTVLARVIELKDGNLTSMFSKEETYYRENFLNATQSSEDILLKEPLKAGTAWTLKDSSQRTIASTSAVVATPLGSYLSIAVVTEGPYSTVTNYYAKDVGLIKSVFSSEGMEISSSLQEIEVNAARVETISFYYPNINDGKQYFHNKSISFRTNDVTSELLTQAYKNKPNTSVGKVFSPNTKINSLSLNANNQVVIDLNVAFVTEMNAGALYEEMILKSIANTFGKYYGAQEVIITIDNQPYSSGHTKMEEGQSISVDFDNADEIK